MDQRNDFFSEAASALPEVAQKILEDGVEWVRNHPTEAALAGAAGGLLLGLSGWGRVYRGVRALRSMPFVSQLVIGTVARGLASRVAGTDTDAIH